MEFHVKYEAVVLLCLMFIKQGRAGRLVTQVFNITVTPSLRIFNVAPVEWSAANIALHQNIHQLFMIFFIST